MRAIPILQQAKSYIARVGRDGAMSGRFDHNPRFGRRLVWGG